jgi:hypothetical protein
MTKSLALALCALCAAACSESTSLPNTHDSGGARTFDPCVPDPLPGYDPKSRGLAGCCSAYGSAHCVPTSDVLPGLANVLMKCDSDDVCMPDAIIRGGGQFMPKTCTASLLATAGVCLSQCIPLVSDNPQSSLLSQDGCGDSELCVPCANPFNGARTGACDLIPLLCTPADGGAGDGAGIDDGGAAMCPYVGPPVIDPTALPACAPACAGAHCLPASTVPTAQQSLLNACTASGGVPGLCAPDPLIATGGNFVPKTCTSVAGAEGRCLSTCLPSVAAEATLLPRDVCDANEKCAPCFNPTASDPTAPTGACSLACDKPAKPPTILSCPWTGPNVVEPGAFPACSPACAGAHCVPSSLVPASTQTLLATCDQGFCTPDPFVATGGNFVPKTCTSVAGAEGRCLSTCLPSVAQQAALLPDDTCGANEKCVPCFNPTAADPTEPTGACSIGCDKPAKPPTVLSCPWTGPNVVDPKHFPDCSPACGGAHCIPREQVPSDEQSLLAVCDSGRGLCAPDPIIASANFFVPKTCASIAGAEGRCLSTCLPSIASKAALLPQDVCADNERCAPCFDPTSATPSEPTGACALGCDMPKQPPAQIMCPYTGTAPIIPPTAFPSCAAGACVNAHCLPADLVPAAQQALLQACPGGGFCTPDPIIATADHFVPPKCTSIAGAEGRCLSMCLPLVASQANLLPQSSCASTERCAPCFNPTATNPDEATGACSLGCDQPTKPPVHITCPWSGPAVVDPSQLPPCTPSCGGSHCLPTALVPAAQRSLLAPCGSGATAGFCTPDAIIQTADNFVPATCTSIAGAEGRCLSTCLPVVSQQASVLPRSTCAANERCTPCFDPTAQNPDAPTGACSLACDKPAKNPVHLTCPWSIPPNPAVIDPTQLASCAGGQCTNAHCLPAQFVPAAQLSLLSTCTPTGGLAGSGRCAPDIIIETAGNTQPPSCTAFAGTTAEGRCLSQCLPAVSSQPTLEQSTCAAGNRCAPCTDPFSGADTGACRSSSCDAPARAAFTFPSCCAEFSSPIGTCVPDSQLSANGTTPSSLPQDSCSNLNHCAPNIWLPGHSPVKCLATFLNFDGTCVAKCINNSIVLGSSTCGDAYKCVPCFAAPAGTPGC